MISRALLVLGLVVGTGCADDVPTLDVMTVAETMTALTPPGDHIPMGLGHYRWELVEAPVTGNEVAQYLSVDTASITITPPVRGIYVFDRWFVGQSTEQLSYRVVVTASAAAPSAVISGPDTIEVSQIATFDGSASHSSEDGSLTFQWRLAVRPERSLAKLDDATMPSTRLLADVPGQYIVELRVMVAGLWSQPGMTTLTAH